jgi:glycosyl transferase family 2
VKLFTGIYNDARLLGYFLRHYRDAGVTSFYIAAAPEFADEVDRIAQLHPVTVVEDRDTAGHLLAGSAAITAMRRRYQGEDEWAIIVDLDEFVEFPEPPHRIVMQAASEGANVVRGVMYDRFSPGGTLVEVGPDDELAALYPVKAQFIRNVMGGCDHKGVLVRGQIAPAPGASHHLFEDERLCSRLLEIAHYKWTPGSVERLRAWHARIVAAGFPWEDQYQRALDHYDRHGRFAWETFGGRLSDEFIPDEPERCALCPAPLSEAEHEFSLRHFGRPLCRFHQKTQPRRAS